MIMWIHPVLQTMAVLLSLYVLYLGFVRFRFAHLGHKGIIFQWKRHVAQGIAVMTVWALAFVIGLGAAWNSWHVLGVTEQHYQLGLAMLPLIIFGLGSGFVMDRVKAKRRLLPLAHGAVNALLVLMALYQLYTGVFILRDMVLG
ncbi:MAG TPA: DUF4079 domain-containing protein [Humidesulfovibrio sp.]|uniref:DUF4079 domain-containing protein n=1 Tax=Humidesulfovibrio sp. TaxID=2910988 RepID=UPI002BC9BCF9|nr:DUF4079 domain-containing protein [Humidesulfovibrio sp.]HWR03103.1 DUF4079 domain-containing protein [Humidesulfovibrio sp.]